MTLTKISNEELLSRMGRLVRTERKITHLVLLHIIEIEDRKLFAELGFSNMFAYLTKELGYSESSAYTRLQSARLLRNIPQVADKLENGSVNLTQLTQVQKCLKDNGRLKTPEHKSEALAILEKIENKNGFETKQILAIDFHLPIATTETLQPQRDNSVRVELTFSEEQYAYICKVRDLLSHVCPNGSLAEVLAFLAQSHIKKIDGRNKSSNTNAPGQNKIQIIPESDHKNLNEKFSPTKSTQSFAASKVRKHISIRIQRRLLMQAQNRCEYKSKISGRRCESTYQLEKDHIYPVAFGGGNDIGNLQILCRTHNQLRARKFSQ